MLCQEMKHNGFPSLSLAQTLVSKKVLFSHVLPEFPFPEFYEASQDFYGFFLRSASVYLG